MTRSLPIAGFATLVVIAASCCVTHSTQGQEPKPTDGIWHEDINFNADWKFTKGDPAGAQAAAFEDSAWQAVRLPHDWAIAGPFDPNVDGYAGKLPWQGVGWYRKSFTVPDRQPVAPMNGSTFPATSRRVYLNFDGVMAFPKVYVNGQLAGEWDYGYMSFRVDATPFIKFGQPNTVAVRADTRQHNSRWYPGAGIYRKVTLTVAEPIHFAHWSTVVTTSDVTDESATVNVRTTVENHTDKPADVHVSVALNPVGNAKSTDQVTGHKSVQVPASGSVDASVSIKLPKPKRWDVNDPQRYGAVVLLQTNEDGIDAARSTDKLLDTATVQFGIRTAEFTADDGFHLNGRRVQLHGVDLHHDLGPLGAAFNLRAMERELEIMKDMGVNALRTSHNPPAPEVLDLCDRMGIVVWDECFDKWDRTADRTPVLAAADQEGARRGGRRGGPLQPPLEEHGKKQLQQFVYRDRNHPSIVVWSIGNEIGTGGRDGLSNERIQAMSDFVRQIDTTRPVGLAHNVAATGSTDILAPLDVVGFNYGANYRIFREHFPTKPILYSESASALSTRGFYELPLPTVKTKFSDKHQVDSYDYNAARWADIPDLDFARMERDKYVAGEFVWTGFDYLGEPTPFSREARSSYFGIVDLSGFPKDRFYLYRSHWRPDTSTVHILPHWNWDQKQGAGSTEQGEKAASTTPLHVPVFVYTNGDNAELFLNGKSLGKRQKSTGPAPAVNSAASGDAYYNITDRYRLRWVDVPFEPGELKAVAYKGRWPIGEAIVRTAGAPAALRATPDRKELAATGDDLCYVMIEALDAHGEVCPLADNRVKFTVTGPAEIAATDNGDPLSTEPFPNPERKLFFGKALVILRIKPGVGGEIRLTSASDGLESTTEIVTSKP